MDATAPDRYSRQIRLAQLGAEGQRRLGEAHVAVVGCGALGAFHAGALARAGIGRITLIDRDFVEWSNLQRQWLYEENDAREALPKAIAAQQHLNRINSSVETVAHVDDLTPRNIDDLLAGAGLILDGTDNFETRYLLNDYSVQNDVPWIYGGAVGAYGLVMPVVPGRWACFECLYPEPPRGAQPTCETAGVLNTITSLIGAWQVSLAFRLIVAGAESLEPSITTMDAWTGAVRQLKVPAPTPECPSCGQRQCRHLQGEGRPPISLCGRNAVQIHDRHRPVDLDQLAARLRPLGEVRSNGFALRFHLAPYELTVFPDGRAIIKGTTDPGLARSLYSRYIGN
jgi:adenylyltransferase/sulfurtransferase